MGLFGKWLKGDSEKWIENASYEELSDTYEAERQQWIRDGYNGGTGEKTQKMRMLDKEMSKRDASAWENDPRRNKDGNFRWTDSNRWDRD